MSYEFALERYRRQNPIFPRISQDKHFVLKELSASEIIIQTNQKISIDDLVADLVQEKWWEDAPRAGRFRPGLGWIFPRRYYCEIVDFLKEFNFFNTFEPEREDCLDDDDFEERMEEYEQLCEPDDEDEEEAMWVDLSMTHGYMPNRMAMPRAKPGPNASALEIAQDKVMTAVEQRLGLSPGLLHMVANSPLPPPTFLVPQHVREARAKRTAEYNAFIMGLPGIESSKPEPKKASPKKAAPKKASPKKAAPKKAAKKAAPKKAGKKTAAPKKAVPKKAAKKAAPKKTAAKKKK